MEGKKTITEKGLAFGKRLEDALHNAGLKPADIGHMDTIDISTATLSKWKNGHVENPNPGLVKELAAILKVNANMLLYGNESVLHHSTGAGKTEFAVKLLDDQIVKHQSEEMKHLIAEYVESIDKKRQDGYKSIKTPAIPERFFVLDDEVDFAELENNINLIKEIDDNIQELENDRYKFIVANNLQIIKADLLRKLVEEGMYVKDHNLDSVETDARKFVDVGKTGISSNDTVKLLFQRAVIFKTSPSLLSYKVDFEENSVLIIPYAFLDSYDLNYAVLNANKIIDTLSADDYEFVPIDYFTNSVSINIKGSTVTANGIELPNCINNFKLIFGQ